MNTNKTIKQKNHPVRTLMFVFSSIMFTGTLQATSLMPHIPAFRTTKLDKAPKITLAAKLPNVSNNAPIFSIKTAQASKHDLQEIAGRLGLDGEAVSNRKGKLAMRIYGDKEEQQTITMFEASGGFFYRYDKQLHAIPNKQISLPERAEAYKIAVNYLKKHDLLSPDISLDQDKVSFATPHLTQFDGKTGETLQDFVTSIEVRFPQIWDGYTVTGSGSKLYVAIGHKGKVLGVTKMWRRAETTKSYLPTISPKQALVALSENPSHLAVPSGCENARIENMKFVYWADSPKVIQRTALPVYHVSGVCIDTNGKSLGEFEGYSPAIVSDNFTVKTEKEVIDNQQDVDE